MYIPILSYIPCREVASLCIVHLVSCRTGAQIMHDSQILAAILGVIDKHFTPPFLVAHSTTMLENASSAYNEMLTYCALKEHEVASVITILQYILVLISTSKGHDLLSHRQTRKMHKNATEILISLCQQKPNILALVYDAMSKRNMFSIIFALCLSQFSTTWIRTSLTVLTLLPVVIDELACDQLISTISVNLLKYHSGLFPEVDLLLDQLVLITNYNDDVRSATIHIMHDVFMCLKSRSLTTRRLALAVIYAVAKANRQFALKLVNMGLYHWVSLFLQSLKPFHE